MSEQTKKNGVSGRYRTFDPRVKFESRQEEEAARVQWSTKSMSLAHEAISQGLPIKHDPFFFGNPSLRKAKLLFRRTNVEQAEFVRCKFDILHFAETYCQLLTGSGDYEQIELRKYQKKMLVAMATHDKVITLGSRQIGKTTTTAIFILWLCIFHKNISVALLGDKIATAVENLNKIKEILYRLPEFLKPGIFGWNVRSITFDNRSRIFTGPCNKASLVGKTINVLFLDELAIPNSRVSKELVDFAFPTIETQIAAGLGKIFVTSTPNGDNIFKDLWFGAIYGKNGFYPIKVPWYYVDGRDAAWRAKKIEAFGIDAFNEQYNCQFLSSSRCIFNDLTIKKLSSSAKRFVSLDPDLVDNSISKILHKVVRRAPSTMTEPIKHFRILKDYDIENFKKYPHLITVDIAEGLMQDYTVFNIFRPKINKTLAENIEKTNDKDGFDDFDDEFAFAADDFDSFSKELNLDIESVDFEQVAIFHSNEHCIRTSALFLRILFCELFDQDSSRIVIELNKYGGQFLDLILTTKTYEAYEISQESIGHMQIGASEKSIPGVMMTPGTKKHYVRACKTDIETGRLLLYDELSIDECKSFGQRPNGSFAATDGAHDDIFMTNVVLSAWANIDNFGFLTWFEEYLSVDYESTTYDEDDLDDYDLY